MSRKRVSREERRELFRKAGRVVLACAAMIDGATPEEIVNAEECVADFVRTWARALASIEPAEDAP